MEQRKKSIGLNAFLNTLRTALNLLFPLITVPYISRVLTVDEIGKYNFSFTIITYVLLISALGIDKYAIREGTKFRGDKNKIEEFASRVFSINIVSTLLSYIILFLYLFFSQKAKSYISCILILSIEVFFTTLGTEWLYSIFEEYTYITIRSIVFKIISIILLFLFVRKPGDYLYYAAITVISSVGSNVLNFIHLRKFCRIRLTFRFKLREMLAPIMVIFATNVAIKIYVTSDTTMLGYLKDDYVVGIYSFSVRIYTIVKTLLAAALFVAIPRLSMYVGKGMMRDFKDLLNKMFNTLMMIVPPAIIGLIMLSKNIIIIIGGENYLQSQSSLIILSVAIFFSIFSTLFSQCILLPFKREKCILRASAISALENISLNFILIPYFAEIGVAFTTVLAELTMTIFNYSSCRDIAKFILSKKTAKNTLSVAVGCLAIIGTCYLICNFVSDMITQTVLSVFISIFVYSLVLLVLKNPIFLNLLGRITERLKRK